MGLFNRYLEKSLKERISSGKIIVLYGPRQVGKTTLIQHILESIPGKILTVNADEQRHIDVFSSRNLSKMKSFVAGYDVLFIDEAQRIPEAGMNLKILHDGLPQLTIIVTGSSSLELAGKINEPLTGRTWTHILFPISLLELSAQWTNYEIIEQRENLLMYGSYPGILSKQNITERRELLLELSRAYLYKDILAIGNIRRSEKIRDLLLLLAYQIGSEVSFSELGKQLSMSKDTVADYINLLEQCFIVFRLSGFSRNLRKEVSRMDKIYFWDTGIRNSVIENFKPLEKRDDAGRLWENFLVSERLKWLSYTGADAHPYFWRTYTGAELDYVEDTPQGLKGYEMKLHAKNLKAPQAWIETYPDSSFSAADQDNFIEFCTGRV